VRAQRISPATDDLAPVARPLLVQRAETRLIVRYVPGEAAGEHDLLLLEERPGAPVPAALEALGLGRREAEVLAWVARGETNEAIAARLSISERTVEKHLAHVYEKLGVATRTAAVAAAYHAVEPLD
jgi:DNA-binding CsgD family transcriptional regulator